jgi:hypothetical protein
MNVPDWVGGCALGLFGLWLAFVNTILITQAFIFTVVENFFENFT